MCLLVNSGVFIDGPSPCCNIDWCSGRVGHCLLRVMYCIYRVLNRQQLAAWLPISLAGDPGLSAVFHGPLLLTWAEADRKCFPFLLANTCDIVLTLHVIAVSARHVHTFQQSCNKFIYLWWYIYFFINFRYSLSKSRIEFLADVFSAPTLLNDHDVKLPLLMMP